MSPKQTKRPLVAVVGATGTGKSQLAVSLAEQFNGEIINGDALQMYEGLPIATNKLSVQERKGVPHHLLGCVRLEEEPWTVRQFHERATSIIDDIRSRGKLPILAGGTHYYTQSLMFNKVLEEDKSEHLSLEEQNHTWPILEASTEDMLEELRKVDPDMAMRWHPKERRKIRRSLEIWLQTGKRASEVYKEQRCGDNTGVGGGNSTSHLSLAHDTLVFWTHARSDILSARLDERVDNMISTGLLDEAQSMATFLSAQQHQGLEIDQGKGIWVAIGFKELLPYLRNGNAPGNTRQEGIERIKIATRQYAKRQARWVRLTLLQEMAMAQADSMMFLLDATDVSQWSSLIEVPAREITAAFLNGDPLPSPNSLSDLAKELLIAERKEKLASRHCMLCNKTLMSEAQWILHSKSKGHRSAARPEIDWQALYPKKERE